MSEQDDPLLVGLASTRPPGLRASGFAVVATGELGAVVGSRPAVDGSAGGTRPCGLRHRARPGAHPVGVMRQVVPDATWITQLRRGAVEHCVLALLSEGERYGLELTRDLAGEAILIGGEGTIYPLRWSPT